eukprot:4590473-Amphidinium_carterae.1
MQGSVALEKSLLKRLCCLVWRCLSTTTSFARNAPEAGVVGAAVLAALDTVPVAQRLVQRVPLDRSTTRANDRNEHSILSLPGISVFCNMLFVS